MTRGTGSELNEPAAAKPRVPGLKHVLTLAQLTLTLALVYFAFRGIDLDKAWTSLARLSAGTAGVCFVVLIIQFVVLAWRWEILFKSLALKVSFLPLLEGVLAERLVNQFIPTTVGGDATRVLALIRDGVRPGPAFQSVLFDRGAGLLGIAFLAGITAPTMLFYAVNTFAVMIPVLLAVGAAVCIMAVALAPEPLVEKLKALTGSERLSWLIHTGQQMMRSRPFYAAVGLVSPLVHLLSCIVFVLIGIAISGTDELWVYAMCAPAVLLATAMPITLAGWGLRESTAVTLLTQFNISSEDALACSLLYGVTQLLTGLIAGIGLLIIQLYRSLSGEANLDSPQTENRRDEVD